MIGLDTQLAATLWVAGVRHLLSSNAADFQIFGFNLFVPQFEVWSPGVEKSPERWIK